MVTFDLSKKTATGRFKIESLTKKYEDQLEAHVKLNGNQISLPVPFSLYSMETNFGDL